MPLLIFSFAGTDQVSSSNSSANAATSTFFNPPDRLSHYETILGTSSTLGISIKTAETHRANIMRKLEIHSVSELVRYAVRNQIVEA
jgi:hypothetical protein